MISAIIPTLNAEKTIERTLLFLKGARLISEIIVIDGGSTDQTQILTKKMGVKCFSSNQGRGCQLAHGASISRKNWLLFLHADTVFEKGWENEAKQFIKQHNSKKLSAVFQFTLDDSSFLATFIEHAVRLRVKIFALPYGDQGLLISKLFYNEIGGYSKIPLMEDVEIIKRIGRKRLKVFKASAITSAERYQRDGYLLRPILNLLCLFFYFCGVSPSRLKKFYKIKS